MCLNAAKCEALNISNKRSPPNFTYAISSGAFSWKSLLQYLGVHINSKLTWSDHCKLTASKDHCLTMHGICLCGVERPYCKRLCFARYTVQNRAARWIMKSYWDSATLKWTKSSRYCVVRFKLRMFLTCLFFFNVFHEEEVVEEVVEGEEVEEEVTSKLKDHLLP